MKFAEEKLTAQLIEEVKPLLEKHWEEIAAFKDIPLDPDYEIYFALQEKGMLKTYSARDDDGLLIGYSVFFIKNHIHYRKTLYAMQDIVYIDPARRGVGLFLIKWCEEQLKILGVQVVSHHIKFSHDWSSALERLGYKKHDMVMNKRI